MDPELVAQNNQLAKDLVATFFNFLDDNRPLLRDLYSAAPSLIWSGNSLEGLETLEEFLAALPKSKHTVDVIEVQPSAAVEGVDILLLTCKGSVVYGSDSAVGFSDSMVLIPAEAGGWVIQNECYRLH